MIISIVVFFACIAIDQITKNIAETRLSPGKEIKHGPATLTLYHKQAKHRWLYVLVTIFALMAFGYTAVSEKETLAVKIMFALLVGGATGNCLDITLKGYVTDFYEIKLINRITNAADTCIITGFAGMFICYLPLFMEAAGRI